MGMACGSEDDGRATLPAVEGNSGGGSAGEQPGPGGPLAGGGAAGRGAAGFIGLLDEEAPVDTTCVDQFAALTERPPVIEFVVDTSGSMNWVPGTERLPDGGELSKWEITERALATAIAAMPDAAAIGITYYPNTTGGGPSCFRPEASAPIQRLTPEHRETIERVNANRIPAGGTPTHAAYEFGIAQLEETPLEGAKFLVLITDGIPTYTLECDGDGQTRVDGAPLVASVEQRYLDDGVRTFVIGSPGSEPAREELSQMAFVGGTGAPGCADEADTCHFDMTGELDFSSSLRDALGDITDAALSCNYEVPEPPTGRSRINLNDVSVVVESAGVPIREFQRSTSGECDSGWQYSGDQRSITLCQATCDELTRLSDENPDVAVRVRFGCSITPA